MRRDHRDLALLLMLASLGVLFLAAGAGYAIIRLRAAAELRIELPPAFWPATAALLLGGWALRRAARPRPPGAQVPPRRSLLPALLAALVFLLIQGPAMAALLAAHRDARAAGVHLYGLVAVLVALHALHVLGGLAPLAAAFRRPDGLGRAGLRRLALYWRFLEVVWLALFGLLLLLG